MGTGNSLTVGGGVLDAPLVSIRESGTDPPVAASIARHPAPRTDEGTELLNKDQRLLYIVPTTHDFVNNINKMNTCQRGRFSLTRFDVNSRVNGDGSQ